MKSRQRSCSSGVINGDPQRYESLTRYGPGNVMRNLLGAWKLTEAVFGRYLPS